MNLTKQQALEKIKELEKYIEEIKKVIVENIEIALEDICSIKKFTELEEDNIKTILEWLIRIQLEEVEKEIDKLKEAIETDRIVVDNLNNNQPLANN